MTQAPPKPKEQARPWMVYKKSDGSRDKLYEPGWAGTLDDDEVERLQQALTKDSDLAYWWSWKPGMKRRAVEAIKRVAMHGDPDNRSHNVRLVREAGRRANAGNESSDSCVTKLVAPSRPRLGRRRIETWESTMLRLAKEGLELRAIAERLQAEGVDISYRTVARRLEEIRGQLQLSLES